MVLCHVLYPCLFLISEGRTTIGGPGHAQRVGEHSIHAPTRSRDLERFLKITVRHITDGQVTHHSAINLN